MIQIDAERGGRALFHETFEDTLPIFPTWDEQPAAFRQTMRAKAVAVASAAVYELDLTGTEYDPNELLHGDDLELPDMGEPEGGD